MSRRTAGSSLIVAASALILPLLAPLPVAGGAPAEQVSRTAASTAATTATAATKAITVSAAADAHVMRNRPQRNFGKATRLRVDGSPKANTYLKFEVGGLSATPEKVTLKLYSRANSAGAVRLHAVRKTGWAERRLTWRNAPEVGTQLDAARRIAEGRWVSFDVSKRVSGNGKVAFAVTTNGTGGAAFVSREGARKPRLVIEAAAAKPVVVAAAGDVACAPEDEQFNDGEGGPNRCHMKATSQLILDLAPKEVFALGDLQYNDGSLARFNASYDLSWGKFKSKTRPVVGNHEYGTAGAAGYFKYFGDAATPRQKGCRSDCQGYYSFDVGAWHAVVLNTECEELNNGDGCAKGSPQQRWLANDLARSSNACTVALLHKPRWSSNSLVEPGLAPLVKTLYDANVDLMLAGHSHSYERFAPQDDQGNLDRKRGIRQIVVGTGGAFFTGFAETQPNSVVRKANIFGVLKLTLRSDRYAWKFLADPETPFSDTGRGTCH